jgi:hypothetical protein
MGFPIFTVFGFAATIAGYYYHNAIVFIAGLTGLFIAMVLMSRTGVS